MKKRRMRLLALFTAVCVASASALSVSAAGFQGEAAEPVGGFQLEEASPEEEERFTEEVTLSEQEPGEEMDTPDPEAVPEISKGLLGRDMIWQEEKEEAPEGAANLRLYKAKDSVLTEEFYTDADGLVEVETASGAVYSYLFDEEGWIRTGEITIGEKGYFFLTAELAKETEGEECPQIGRMMKDYWAMAQTGSSPQWNYYGKDGAMTAAPQVDLNVYELNKNVLWAEEEDAPEGKVPYRLYWLSEEGGYSRYFSAMDGTVTLQREPGTSDLSLYTYAFDEDGYLKEGYQTVAGEEYYFTAQAEAQPDADGGCSPASCDVGAAVKNQWKLVKDGSRWCYFGNEEGKREDRSGYLQIDGAYYYLSEEGDIRTGILLVDGVNRYFSPDTEPMGQERPYSEARGWIYTDGRWLYIQEDGTAQVRQGFQKVATPQGNVWYYLDETGAPVRNYMAKYEKNGRTYYFGEDGTRTDNQLVNIDGKKYYFDKYGIRAEKKWVKYNNNRYYFGEDGAWIKKTGWQQINKFWFYFSSNGNMYRGRFITVDGQKYYVSDAGTMLTGLREIDGYKYYFKKSQGNTRYGYMLKSRWVKGGNKWYYVNENGRMQKGWIHLGTNQYYLNEECELVTNKWMTNPDGVKGYLDDNGLFRKAGWADYKGQVRYLMPGAEGGWAVGWHKIDGYKYYFDKKGNMVLDVSNMPGLGAGPYLYDVNRTSCTVTVLGKDTDGSFTVPVIAFMCSVGLPGTPTPLTPAGSTHPLNKAGRWQLLMGPSYGQYATHVVGAGKGGIFFHSVAGHSPNHYAINPVEFNRLGSPASHGCIRLCVRDAKWIWDHWGAGGNRARIVDRAVNIFYKPNNVPKIGPDKNYDPTDPAL